MEKKFENVELKGETLKEVSGGIIDSEGEQAMGAMVRLAQKVTQQNLDSVKSLIGPDPTFGMFNVVPTDQVEDKNVVFY